MPGYSRRPRISARPPATAVSQAVFNGNGMRLSPSAAESALAGRLPTRWQASHACCSGCRPRLPAGAKRAARRCTTSMQIMLLPLSFLLLSRCATSCACGQSLPVEALGATDVSRADTNGRSITAQAGAHKFKELLCSACAPLLILKVAAAAAACVRGRDAWQLAGRRLDPSGSECWVLFPHATTSPVPRRWRGASRCSTTPDTFTATSSRAMCSGLTALSRGRSSTSARQRARVRCLLLVATSVTTQLQSRHDMPPWLSTRAVTSFCFLVLSSVWTTALAE